MLNYRKIEPADNEKIAKIIRSNLEKLYLDDSVKGKGYGKELMKTAEAWARSAGYEKLYLETHTNLSTALNLYEKTRFERIEKPCSTQHGTMNRFYLKKL